MPRTSHQPSLRNRVSAVAAVSVALLLPAVPSHAAAPDDAPAGSMIIAVVVPERSSPPGGSTPGGSTPGGSSPSQDAGTDPLAVTGLDATALWAAALAAAGAIALGGGAVAVSRRRRP